MKVISSPTDFQGSNKQAPFTVPQGCFESLEKSILANTVESRQVVPSPKPATKSTLWAQWIPTLVGAAAVALMALLPHAPAQSSSDDFEQVDAAFAHLSDADRTYLVETYEDIEFINQL